MIISADKKKVKKNLEAILASLDELILEYEPMAMSYYRRVEQAPISKVPFFRNIIPWIYSDGARLAAMYNAIMEEQMYFKGLQDAMEEDTGRVLFLSDEDVFNINYALREYVVD